MKVDVTSTWFVNRLDEEPFSALAFKIMTDPFVGSLTFVGFIPAFWKPATAH